MCMMYILMEGVENDFPLNCQIQLIHLRLGYVFFYTDFIGWKHNK
jgi:hypothetical protein